MNRVFLLLGSNEGDRQMAIEMAVEALENAGLKLVNRSAIYETEPWGFKDQNEFLNLVIEVHTELDPKSLLQLITKVESKHGRSRSQKWGPRILDIDILLFGDQIINEKAELCVPHPMLPERNFALIPLMEIAGDVVHPATNKTIEALYLECSDESEVRLLN